MKIEKIKIKNLNPAKYNPRKELKKEDESYQRIKKSIEEFGLVDPLIINSRNMTIIGGHQRFNILKDLGYDAAECIILDLDEKQEKRLNLSLNKNSGFWDEDKLELLFKELELTEDELFATGFSKDEVDELITDVFNEFEDDNFDVEEEVKKIEEPTTKLGNVWILGEHKLMCGDSTSENDVKKLMGDEKAKCIFTSPPYNMSSGMYENYEDNLESRKYIDFNLSVVKLWRNYLKGFLFWNISYNKNSRWEFIEILYKIVKETGLRFMELIVWDKGHAMPITSKSMLTRQYEDILMVGDEESIAEDMELYYLGTTDKKAYFNKKIGKGISNYWRITTGNTQLDNHKACFPLNLPTRAIELTTNKDDIVIDCFGGSGTTLIACEKTNRKCRLMELDPVYCDIIVKRWESLTGQKAKLE